MQTCPSCTGPISPEAGLSISRRAYPSRGGLFHPGGGFIHSKTGQSIPRRAYPSRRRTYPFRGGPIHFEAGQSISRRTNKSRGRPIFPDAGLPRIFALPVWNRACHTSLSFTPLYCTFCSECVSRCALLNADEATRLARS